MSTTPDRAPPAAQTEPVAAVPYGPPVSESDQAVPSAVTVNLTPKSVAGTAGKWALRVLVMLVIRAIFRAIARG